MATTNRDRVHRGFEILAEGLEPFVDERMTKDSGDGANWLAAMAARESARHGTAAKFSKSDPQLQLKVITEYRNVFFEILGGHTAWRFASELRETRNLFAHNEKFSSDDTYRALDTMERLLRAAGSITQADTVRRLRDDHQRATYDSQARDRTRKTAEPAQVDLAGYGLKAWREIITPHPDVLSGDMVGAEFAANLHDVATGQSYSEEYSDPVSFFRRTYLTESLTEMLAHAARRFSGDTNAQPVFKLQTNFGGGKTHSMLSLWHLCSPDHALTEYPQAVQDAVGSVKLPDKVSRVALVGNAMGTAVPISFIGDVPVNTVWGELARQLGGREAFELVAENDRLRVPPASDQLRELIARYSPCLILIDEWVAYARLLYNREDLPAGTFEAQVTFAQNLTEAVKSVPGAMFVVSVPASDGGDSDADQIELGGAYGKEALKRLDKVIGRVDVPWRPASQDESFEIVRRRLFQELDAEHMRERDVVVKAVFEYYKANHGDFPAECADRDYQEKLKRAYPIHPSLFEMLYDEWSTLEKFQRTRGVLRLMSHVIQLLWSRQDPAPLILPGSLPLADAAVRNELAQYLPDGWKAIIDKDVDGIDATPGRIDKSRPAFEKRQLTRWLARATFLGSAAKHGSAQRGIERKRLWLATALPGDVLGNFGTALDRLGDQSMYFYSESGRYWYDSQASVNRLARNKAEELTTSEVDVEIVRRLQVVESRHPGSFRRVHAAPTGPEEIPDLPEARLVLIHPKFPHSGGKEQSAAEEFAVKALDSKGSTPRVHRNMLVFVAARDDALDDLRREVRDYLAWDYIFEERLTLNIPPREVERAKKNRGEADKTVETRLVNAYGTALFPVGDKEPGKIKWDSEGIDESGDHVGQRVSEKVKHLDKLRVQMGPRLVRYNLDSHLVNVWSRGHVAFGQLWEYYSQYPYLPRLVNRRVLEQAVENVFTEATGATEGFALASGYDQDADRYIELAIPGTDRPIELTDATLLVDLVRARAQREQDEVKTRAQAGEQEGDGSQASDSVDEPQTTPGSGAPGGAQAAKRKPTRFWGSYEVNADRHSREFAKVSQELLHLLEQADGVALKVTVQIEADCETGFPDDTIMKVRENLDQMRAEGHFEDS